MRTVAGHERVSEQLLERGGWRPKPYDRAVWPWYEDWDWVTVAKPYWVIEDYNRRVDYRLLIASWFGVPGGVLG